MDYYIDCGGSIGGFSDHMMSYHGVLLFMLWNMDIRVVLHEFFSLSVFYGGLTIYSTLFAG